MRLISIDTDAIQVISGAAGAIGFACARELAPRGPILMSDIAADRLTAAANSLRGLGYTVHEAVTDVSDESSVAALADRAHQLGTIVAVVHSAGARPGTQEWRRTVEVNLIGSALVANAFLPLATPGTALVGIASVTAYRPVADDVEEMVADPLRFGLLDDLAAHIDDDSSAMDSPWNPYTISKLGMLRWYRSQAWAWAERGARILTVSPGVIDSQSEPGPGSRPVPDRVASSPLKRLGQPREVAAAVGFLCSPAASFITGTDVLVDGGISLLPWSTNTAPST